MIEPVLLVFLTALTTLDIFSVNFASRQPLLNNEVKPSPSKLFFVEVAIVATMLLDLRMAYLNEVYDITGVYIGVKQSSDENICSQTMATKLTKESMETQLPVKENSMDTQVYTVPCQHLLPKPRNGQRI